MFPLVFIEVRSPLFIFFTHKALLATSNKKRNLTIGLSVTFGLLLIASLIGLLIFIQKRYQVRGKTERNTFRSILSVGHLCSES